VRGLESSTSKSAAVAGLGSIRGVFTHHRKWPLRRGATAACVSKVCVSYATFLRTLRHAAAQMRAACYRPRQQAHASATKRCVAAAAVGTCKRD
jgi:hypothetical protein